MKYSDRNHTEKTFGRSAGNPEECSNDFRWLSCGQRAFESESSTCCHVAAGIKSRRTVTRSIQKGFTQEEAARPGNSDGFTGANLLLQFAIVNIETEQPKRPAKVVWVGKNIRTSE